MGLISDSDDGQKPLFRKWYRQQKKDGYSDTEIRDTVIRVRLSGSEEWLLIEGRESVALVNADSKIGLKLWGTIQSFGNKQLLALLIIPAKGKLGFDLEPNPEEVGFWSFDSEDIIFGEDMNPTIGAGLTNLSLESMTPKSVNGSGKIGHGGTGEAPTDSSTNGKGTVGEKRSRRSLGTPGA